MPYLSIQTNQPLDENSTAQLVKKASQLTAEILGKPESYVMVAIQAGTTMSFAGSSEPTAYVQLKSLGLPESSTADFSQAFCNLIHLELNISTNRVYIEFSSPQRHMWGWDNRTF